MSPSDEVCALMRMALDHDDRFEVVGEALDTAYACALVKGVRADALIFDERNHQGEWSIAKSLEEALPGVALLAFSPGRPAAERRFVTDAAEMDWAETALSVGNALAMLLQAREPAL